MNKYTFVGNQCQMEHLYKHYNRPYDFPLLAIHIYPDMDYLKFCKNYEYYTNLVPKFKKKTDKNYPVMLLGDLTLNCYHYKTEEEILSKFERRKNRGKDNINIFIWGDNLLYDLHSKDEYEKIKTEFKNLPNSIYLEAGKELADIPFDSSIQIGANINSFKNINLNQILIKSIEELTKNN